MTDLRSELTWLVEHFKEFSDLVEGEWGGSAENYERDVARADAILALTDWQPIETAPRDGTRILVAADDYVGMARFESDRLPEYCWVDEEGSGAGSNSVTHWMPLPDPPQGDKP